MIKLKLGFKKIAMFTLLAVYFPFNLPVSSLNNDLLCAIKTGNIKEVEHCLSDSENSVPDENGRTALMYASICNNSCIEKILELILRSGNAQMDAVDKYGNNAFVYATISKNDIALNLLKKYGVKENNISNEFRANKLREEINKWNSEIEELCPIDITSSICDSGELRNRTIMQESDTTTGSSNLSLILNDLDNERDYSFEEHGDSVLSEIYEQTIRIRDTKSIVHAKIYSYFRTQYNQNHDFGVRCLELFEEQIDILREQNGKIRGTCIDKRFYALYAFNYAKAALYLYFNEISQQENISYEKIDRISREYAMSVIKGAPLEIKIDPIVKSHHNTGMFKCLINPLLDLVDTINDTLFGIQDTIKNLEISINQEVLRPVHECVDTYKQVGEQLNTTIDKIDDRLLLPIKKFISTMSDFVIATAEAKKAEAQSKKIEAYGNAVANFIKSFISA